MISLFAPEALHQLAHQVFLALGCTPADAQTAADNLVHADLRGIDSHGVARLSGYVRLADANRVNVKPSYKIVRERPSTAVMDADGALGLVAGTHAMQLAIDKAQVAGSGFVAVHNSNHFGIGASFILQAARQGMIGWAMTNASPLVAPMGGKERLLGTNPISFAFPGGKYDPVVCDMSTTTAANGKLEILQRKNLPTPNGWLQDKDGHPTNDAWALKHGGALLPLGGEPERGAHKGYCLGAAVDIFSGVLSGANFGPWVPPFVSFLPVGENLPGKGIGHFFGALSIDAFMDMAEYEGRIAQWIERFKACEPIDPATPVIIPGDIEAEEHRRRAVQGIPLLKLVIEDLQQLAQRFSLAFPEPLPA